MKLRILLYVALVVFACSSGTQAQDRSSYKPRTLKQLFEQNASLAKDRETRDAGVDLLFTADCGFAVNEFEK